jgi:hypothetical protein
VLSQNREAASFMLMRNGLEGIVPLERCLTDDGWLERTRSNFSAEVCFAAPWTGVPWSDRAVEKAVVANPQLRDVPGGEDALRLSIRNKMSTFQGNAREQLTPIALLRKLLVSDEDGAGNIRSNFHKGDQISSGQEETGCFSPDCHEFECSLM